MQHPLVEDTQHVDRKTFRLQLDRPDLAPWLRSLAATDQLPLLALLLALAGAIANLDFQATIFDRAPSDRGPPWRAGLGGPALRDRRGWR